MTDNKIELDRSRVLDLLDDVVAEAGPDYVDPRSKARQGCVYVDDNGAPCCIVGRVLVRAGVPADRLANVALSAELLLSQAITDIVDADRAAVTALDAAQGMQDHGGTWGEALDAARRAS